jgi:hypothetical protein
MPHSSWPRRILKKPDKPQSGFHELATNQYGVPDSTPQPARQTRHAHGTHTADTAGHMPHMAFTYQ